MSLDSDLKKTNFSKASTAAVVPIPVLACLLFYIGTLAATQTAYGMGFMTLRWYALGLLTLVSFVYWLFGRIPSKEGVKYRRDPFIVFVFLGATLLSATAGENYQFSGLKWGTQGMLILSCMVFLRRTLNTERLGDLLVPLKVLTLLLLGVSIVSPATSPAYDSPYFRGAMGDANSLGHVSAICALVYLQGAITARHQGWRLLQLAVGALAVTVLIRTGARSSMTAFMAGLILINLYSGLFRSLLAKAALFLLAAFIFASPMLQSKALLFLTKEERKNEGAMQMMTIERRIKTGLFSDTLFVTRERLWSEAWEGFTRRPLLGWGFGANADIPKEWSVRPTGIGLTRDITNDILFILEGSGLVGFLAYLGLMFSILRQSPTHQQLLLIRSSFRRGMLLAPTPANAQESISRNSSALWRGTDRPGKAAAANGQDDLTLSRAYAHSQTYILSVSLFVLFLLDGSAFSAGSLISAIFWISAGAASLARAKTLADERMNERVFVKGPKGFRFQGFKWKESNDRK